VTKEPYDPGLLDKPPIVEKSPIETEAVCVLHSKLSNRGLELVRTMTRAVRTEDVHEFIVTDEPDAAPGSAVDRIAYVGFFRVRNSGIVAVGDVVETAGRRVGRVVGFDATHAPNHWNIVIRADSLVDGLDLGLKVRDVVAIRPE